jgi:hypothetical protein
VIKFYKFSMYARKFIGLSNCNRVPDNRSILQFYISVYLTKARYSMRLSVAERENVSVRISPDNFIAYGKK